MSIVRRAITGLSLAALVALAGCQGPFDSLYAKEKKPIPPHLVKKMEAKGMTAASPIMVRFFKRENVAEVWKETDTGRYDLLAEYEICKWSGALGPKFQEGDRQAPEGFYSVKPWQMNPKSDYHLAFNIGFPNVYDRSHGRTGSHLMVHGACSSAGCYSMTDDLIEEIYSLARESFEGGQRAFQVQAYPFRMTPENMADNKDSPHFEFWRMLKEGHDHFEITRTPPKVDVCGRRYVFNREAEEGEKFKPEAACPAMSMPESLEVAYADKLSEHQQLFQKALQREAMMATLRGEAPPPFDTIASIAPPNTNYVPAMAYAPASAGLHPAASSAAATERAITTQTAVSTGDLATQAAATPDTGAAVPIPQRSPLAQPVTAEKPKRRGLFGLFRRDG